MDGNLISAGSCTDSNSSNVINHADLNNLSWLIAGHTGGNSKVAGFDGSGNAVEYDLSALTGDTNCEVNGSCGNIVYTDTNSFVPRNLVNGSFTNKFNALLTSDGTDVNMNLQSAEAGDLNMQFSDGITLLDCTPSCKITLTVGGDSSPQDNYVYIPQDTKVLTTSTSSFPNGTEHIKIGYFLVPSAAYVQNDGAYINQNWNNYLSNGDEMGFLMNLAERVRRDGAYYFSGISPNGTDQDVAISYVDYKSVSESYIKASAGVIYQMHRHTVPAFDSNVSGNDLHVVNYNGNNYMTIHQLNDIDADSQGNPLNNEYFNLFLFAVGNKTGEYAPMMLQLPDCGYVTETSAVNDVDGCDNLSMPRQFALDSSTGVPIARITLKYSGGLNTLEHVSTTDLRSSGITAGGGATGGTTHFIDNQFDIASVGDITKLMAFDVGTLITAGNTRTYVAPDKDGTIALLDDITVHDQNIYSLGLMDIDSNSWLVDVNGGGKNLINFNDGTFDGNVVANSFRAGHEQTITASEQTITQTGQNTVALTLGGIFNSYVIGSTNPVFNDGTQLGQVMVVKVVDYGFPFNTLTIKDDSANGKVNLQGDKFFSSGAGMEDVLIVMWDGSLWQEVYRNLGVSNDFSGASSGWGGGNEFSGGSSGWGSGNEFSGGSSGWGSVNDFIGSNSGWGNKNVFSGLNSGWGAENSFSSTNAGWGQSNNFSGRLSGWGYNNIANAFQASFGRFSTDQGHATNWVATDDLFKIGIGASDGARADAFRLLKNGESHWETDQKHYYGLDSNTSVGWDGINFVVDTNANGGDGNLWLSNNVSAIDFITRTSVFDKERGDALSLVKDADELIDEKGEILHDRFAGYTTMQVTDFSRPEIEIYEYESIDENNNKIIVQRERTIYPHKKLEDGVSLGTEIDVLRQAVYDLGQTNELLKTELCSVGRNAYSWCAGIGLGN